VTQAEKDNFVEILIDEISQLRENGQGVGTPTPVPDAEKYRVRQLLVEALDDDEGDLQPSVTNEEIRCFAFGGNAQFGDLWQDGMRARFPTVDEILVEFWEGEHSDPADHESEPQPGDEEMLDRGHTREYLASLPKFTKTQVVSDGVSSVVHDDDRFS
jgi:hypothetical protein